MKKIFDFIKKNKFMTILIGILLIVIIVVCVFAFSNNDKKLSGKKKLVENTYTMYVKINPTVKLIFKETYFECENDLGEKEICSSINDEVIDYELVNNDAKEIYYNTDLKGKNILNVLVTLCDVASDNKVAFNNFEVITNWDNMYSEEEIKNAFKENSKYETEYEVILDFQKVFEEDKIEEDEEEKLYIVSFNSNGGTKIDNQLIKENEKAKEPKSPTKNGYEFVEWQLNEEKYNFKNKVVSDINLVAKWKKIEIKEEQDNELEEPKIESKVFENIEVNIKNLKDGFQSNKIIVKVTVEGTTDNLKKVNKDNISLYVDLKNYKAGTYETPILIDNPISDIKYNISPTKAKITISKIDTTQSRIEKINLNENILYSPIRYGFGSDDSGTFKIFATNLETLFPGYVKNNTITIATQSFLDEFAGSDWFDPDELLHEDVWNSKKDAITYDSAKEEKLINVFNNLKSSKKVGIDHFEYTFNNHKLESYNFGTIDLEDYEKFITLNDSLRSIQNEMTKSVNSATKGIYTIEYIVGGRGSYEGPQLLTEDVCTKYNLICERW